MLFHEEDMIPQSRQEFEDRKDNFVQELRDAGIPRRLLEPMAGGAVGIYTDQGLDKYLDLMTFNHGR